MANFAASVLNAGQALFLNTYTDNGEWRAVDFAAIQVMNKGAITNPLLANLRTSELRAVHAYLPIRQTAGGGTTRTHDHTGSAGDSKDVTITWSTLSEKFKVSAKLSNNNVLQGAQMFAAELKNAIDNLLERSNALLIAQLLAGKTQVNAGGANGTFNATDDNYEVANTQADYFFQEVKKMMSKNKYKTQIVSIVDAKAAVLAERGGWQGVGNDKNLAPQYAGQTIVGTDSDIITGQSGSVISFPANGVAFQPWIPAENRKPLNASKIMDGVGDFGQIAIPELGVNFAVHAYSARANTSAIGGSTQDVVTEFEISIDWAYASSPISVTDETNVFTSVLKS